MTLAKNKEQEAFLALRPEGLEIIRANFVDLHVSPWDMDRAKVPAGGGSTWEIPDLDEGVKAVKALTGIILHWMPTRTYWSKGLDDGESGPPDCSSTDLERGIGDPGGECAVCPFNQWDSAEKGSGKACKERRLLFLLQPDSYLPLLVQVPTMSLKPLNQYLMRLASKGIMYHSVVTSLTLDKSQQRGGANAYAKIIPTMARRLTEEEHQAVKGLVATFQPTMPQSANQRLND